MFYLPTADLHGGSWGAPFPGGVQFHVDAPGGSTALPAGMEALQGAGHPERWTPPAIPLPDWLRFSNCDCGRFCLGVF